MKSKFFTLTTLVSFSLSPLAFTAETEKAAENAKQVISLEDFQRHLAELSAEEATVATAEEIPTIQEEALVAIQETPLPEVTPMEDSQVVDPLLDAPDTYQLDAEFIEEPEQAPEAYEVSPANRKGLSVSQTRTRQNILLAIIAVAVAVAAIILVSENQGCEVHNDNHH